MGVTNSQRQYVRALQQRKWRRKYGTFVVEGLTNIKELLNSPLKVIDLYATDAALSELSPLLERLGLNAHFGVNARTQSHELQMHLVGDKELGRLSSQRSPHGAVAVAEQPIFDPTRLQADRVLYLDGISDPGNVGTLMRSAEWFGFECVLAGEETADFYNPKTVAATRGALFRVAHGKRAQQVLAEAYPQHKIIVADLDGEDLETFEWPSKSILVVGSESLGPSQLLQEAANAKVTIVPSASSASESLNVGVAGSLLMAAAARQSKEG